ncbi:hypothetical protein ST47_g6396 [Ascochyta rabiei]|uniref:DNA binding n=1 Tax=Didymella rabiei TaxID=5454 RepID=A0A163CIA0_DIDRA|nr:hypothetical protein ST47_g6396 [Ascochyta rabiei]
MESRLEKGPICGVENCRSRWQGLIRAADDDDFTLATTTRTRKKKDVNDQVKVVKHFSGRHALDLYLKCLQLILRHQVWYLIKDQGLPAELEFIVFDLWALRIAQFGERIASDNRIHSQPQSQVFSTLETDESETDGATTTLRTPKGRERKLDGIPNLLDCLALCYLGILTLRLPITPGDIYHWVTEGKLAYRGAIKCLPLTMRDRLSPSYHATLNPNALLRYKRFYAALTDLQISITKDHKIAWAPLNHRLLLFRYLKELGLPLEVYDVTVRLGKLLGYDFVFQQEGKKKLGIRHLPEAQLVGCLIVCVKLLYPFHDEQRHPRSATEPTAAVINWRHWHEQLEIKKREQKGANQRFTVEDLTNFEENDIFDLTSDNLDQYLDFYAETFLDDAEIQRTKSTDDFRNAMYGMFPIESGSAAPAHPTLDMFPENDKMAMVEAVHGSIEVRATVDDEHNNTGTLRPGQLYRSYKKEKDLPEHAKAFHEEVAKLAGLSMDMLTMAVFFTEARIQKWRRTQEADKQRPASV